MKGMVLPPLRYPLGSRFERAFATPLLAVSALILGGVFGFMAIEGWNLLDAVWMAIITLSTIGYGEVHPLSDAGRWFTVAYILAGVGVALHGMTQFARYVAEGGLMADLEERRQRARIAGLNDHFIVVGYGRLGRELVADMRHAGAEVLVVDQNACEIEEDGVWSLVGDATRDEVLDEAGIERARGIAIATPSDAVNVYITLSARALNPDVEIAVRIEDDAAQDKARRAGANDVLLPYHLAGNRMARALLHPGSSRFVDHATLRQHDDLMMVDVPIREASSFVGTLVELDLRRRYGVAVVARQRAGERQMRTPEPEDAFRPGDVMVVVGTPEKVANVVRDAGGAL